MRQIVKTIHPKDPVGLEYILNSYISIGWSVVTIVPFTADDGLMSHIVVFQMPEDK